MATADFTIELDLTRDLPKVRRSYGRLIKRMGECSYSSPCAVGAMMTPAQRKKLAQRHEDGTSIDALVDTGLVAIPPEQLDDLVELQDAFDRRDRDAFGAKLIECERKYLAKVSA